MSAAAWAEAWVPLSSLEMRTATMESAVSATLEKNSWNSPAEGWEVVGISRAVARRA
jgi:hypothetical protein